MKKDSFVTDYLRPFRAQLNSAYAVPLPPIPGLEKCEVFSFHAESGDTTTTNVISKHVSQGLGIRLVEVYNNTHNRVSGNSHRNVGMLSIVKEGYPILTVDATIRNVDPTGLTTNLFTRVGTGFYQAAPEQTSIFFDAMRRLAQQNRLPFSINDSDSLPSLCSSVFTTQSDGVDLNMIREHRALAWLAYKEVFDLTAGHVPFDYRPTQELGVFLVPAVERRSYQRQGFDVPAELIRAVASALLFKD